MNLKSAPFHLIESVVAATLGKRPAGSSRIVQVTIHGTKLVDEVKGLGDPADVPAVMRADCTTSFPRPSARTDGHIEPARVAPAQAAPSAPAEIPNLGRPGIANPGASI